MHFRTSFLKIDSQKKFFEMYIIPFGRSFQEWSFWNKYIKCILEKASEKRYSKLAFYCNTLSLLIFLLLQCGTMKDGIFVFFVVVNTRCNSNDGVQKEKLYVKWDSKYILFSFGSPIYFLSYHNFYVIILKWCIAIKKILCLTFEYFYYFLIFLFIVYFPFTWECLILSI